MTTIRLIEPAQAQGKVKELYDMAQKKIGKVANVFQVMGNSPAVLESYFSFSGSLQHTGLSARQREMIALATAESNRCDYCLAAHSAIAKGAGLSEEEIMFAREGKAREEKDQAIISLAVEIEKQKGKISDSFLTQIRTKGITDAEIVETVAVVSLNIFTNYINHIASTPIDFPAAAPRKSGCCCSGH